MTVQKLPLLETFMLAFQELGRPAWSATCPFHGPCWCCQSHKMMCAVIGKKVSHLRMQLDATASMSSGSLKHPGQPCFFSVLEYLKEHDRPRIFNTIDTFIGFIDLLSSGTFF